MFHLQNIKKKPETFGQLEKIAVFILTFLVWLHHTVMCQKDGDRMVKTVWRSLIWVSIGCQHLSEYLWLLQ